jgi:bacteriorhodopsin
MGVGLGRVFKGLFSAALVAKRRSVMGKYVIGWLLGVPVIVLVIIYLLMN